ncbi:hypothetical protein ES332_D13G288200v1 [Gossypium tomentosum]|uniref:2Fe-2S ferredoxin-type domain-containing protein n=1 Tax=Gossypium tomentosum TaxID=34277 RepID=A0A5D2I2J5_GOSTO|nr:hypothetical protein ES332_D13G288200v1 [Gossypium tomentosum]
MAMYKIKLVGPKGEVNEFEVPDNQYILEAAEAAGVELPYCCRAGACSICTAKVVSGTYINQKPSTSRTIKLRMGIC